MNVNKNIPFLYEKMKLNLLNYKENILKHEPLLNPLKDNIYSLLEKLLNEIITTSNIPLRNRKIGSTFKWFTHSIKQSNETRKASDSKKIIHLIPPISSTNKAKVEATTNTSKDYSLTPSQKIINVSDCFETTRNNVIFCRNKVFSIKSENKELKHNNSNPNYKIRFCNKKYINSIYNKKNEFENKSVRNKRQNRESIISINKNKSVSFSDKTNDNININNTYKKRFLKHFKITHKKCTLSKTGGINKSCSNDKTIFNISNNKIIDILHNIQNEQNAQNINNELISLNNDQLNFQTLYSKINQNSTRTISDLRQTVSSFRYKEFKSLQRYLLNKKRKYNSKSLHDAFINPESDSHSTFYLPRGGSGLLSKPDYLD